MSDTIIKVENLSKRYRIGLQEKKADTFAQQMVNALKYPIDNFRKIKNLGRFQTEDEEGVHWAIKDVSFEVKQGEVLGIIGKNGAGKSTLLKILSKITEPTSGRIEMNGRVAALLEVGTGFHPELTGRENIYMNGTILGMTKKEIDRKLEEIIDFSGVEKYVDTPVKFYSSGMRVRLGFSVAAHLEPEILIIDEVLAVGDHDFQQKCLGKMEDVASQGRTVLFVSHNMAMMKNLCKAGLLLENGEIKYIGSIIDSVDNYLRNDQNELQGTILGLKNDSKEIYFKEINFKGRFITGTDFTFEFDIVNKLNEKTVEAAVTFTSLDGAPILQYYSGHVGKIFNLVNGENKVSMDIVNFPLANGFYYINLWLGSKGISFDFLKKYQKIEVKEGRIITNGPICTYNNYPVIHSAVWY